MKLQPYIRFDGRCREAFDYYRALTGGQILTMMPYGGSPGEEFVGPDWHDKIFHATLAIGDQELLGMDAVPGSFQPLQGFAVTMEVATPDEARRVFAALADGGTVDIPLQETSWTRGFAQLTDRFGVPWIINCA